MPKVSAPDGASIAYEPTGEGPALVFVHGITECRRSWDPLIAPLARDHRVVAVDLRGHGESDRRPPGEEATFQSVLQQIFYPHLVEPERFVERVREFSDDT